MDRRTDRPEAVAHHLVDRPPAHQPDHDHPASRRSHAAPGLRHRDRTCAAAPANDASASDPAGVDRRASPSLAATSAANQCRWARPVAQCTSAVPMAHEPWAGQPMAGGAAPALLGRPSRASLPGEPPAAAKPAYRPGAPSEATATVKTWTAADRILLVAASQQSYLVVNENFNAGWQARSGQAD